MEPLVGADVVVGVGGVVTEVDLDRFDSPGEVAGRGPRSSLTGVSESSPRSVVSSAEKSIGWVASTRPFPTWVPSMYRVAVPPFPSPPPS